MCGLAGMATIGAPLGAQARPVLERMGRAVAHRGPDGQNLLIEGPVGLVFRRLALVGPENGDQPLHSADGGVSLIANGEVYNHRELEARIPGLTLRTKSDCEILAHLYARDGDRFLDEVAGMFAVVLWDRRRNRLLLARDRFGIKPLYYARFGGTVVFASEIKALFEHPDCPRELVWASAVSELAPGAASSTVTSWFRGIEVVPAATIVSIDLSTGTQTQTPYWRFPDFGAAQDDGRSDEEFIAQYRELLTAAVRDCASADTELGLMLSGGVDSATVAALMAAGGTQAHTFTVLSGSTFAGDAEFGARVAAHLGLPNHQIVFGNDRVPSAAEWRNLLWLLETPLCGAEQFYKHSLYTYAKQVRPELRGMLLGQASDEYNGGYSAGLAFGGGWPEFEATTQEIARNEALGRTPSIGSWWSVDGVGPLLSDELLIDGRASGDPYQAYVEFGYRSIQQYNCWHEDRTAAGHGVEARVPFLDHRLIEFLATIPRARRAGLLWDKRILRDGVRDLLPGEVVNRSKGSFFYQDQPGFAYRMLARMLGSDGGELVEEALAAAGAAGVLDGDRLRAAVARLATASEPTAVEPVLALVNLGLLDTMARSLPPEPVLRPRYEVVGAPMQDWDAESGPLGSLVRRFPLPAPQDVLALGDEVLLATQFDDPGMLLVAVSGSIEYVVNRADDAAWHSFLGAVDGERTLEAILAHAGIDLPSVEETLRFALDAELLRSRQVAPADLEPIGASAGGSR
jgi:asparagine synthase (glutamine-hydrolysing)